MIVPERPHGSMNIMEENKRANKFDAIVTHAFGSSDGAIEFGPIEFGANDFAAINFVMEI